MASSINASTSGPGGVITTADNSGILNLQSGGNTVATVNSAGMTTVGTVNVPNTFGFKNRIINGAMVIDQRNSGASGTATVYTVDRWYFDASQSSKGTWGQNLNSVTPPAGFTNYLGFQSSSSYSVGSTDYFGFFQKIEGYNIADLGWGTANGKTITLSFWVYSSLTGTFGGALKNNSANQCYPFTYSISSANTWTQVFITIPAPNTGSTWLTNNSTGILLYLSLGMGSTYSGTAGTWSGNNYASATGATSVVGTNSATWYITGVQLEVGSQATSFDFRSIGTELALCQRYYSKSYDLGTAPGTSTSLGMISNIASTTIIDMGFRYPVNMRTAASFAIYDPNTGTAGNYAYGAAGTSGTWATIAQGSTGFVIRPQAGFGAGNGVYFHYSASAEL